MPPPDAIFELEIRKMDPTGREGIRGREREGGEEKGRRRRKEGVRKERGGEGKRTLLQKSGYGPEMLTLRLGHTPRCKNWFILLLQKIRKHELLVVGRLLSSPRWSRQL